MIEKYAVVCRGCNIGQRTFFGSSIGNFALSILFFEMEEDSYVTVKSKVLIRFLEACSGGEVHIPASVIGNLAGYTGVMSPHHDVLSEMIQWKEVVKKIQHDVSNCDACKYFPGAKATLQCQYHLARGALATAVYHELVLRLSPVMPRITYTVDTDPPATFPEDGDVIWTAEEELQFDPFKSFD